MDLAAGPAPNGSPESPAELAAMHEVMVKTLLGISETWYVKILADERGEEETFDVTINLDKNLVSGSIFLCEFLDEEGNLVEVDPADAGDITVSRSSIEIDDLEVDGELTLAFKVGPGQAPLKFDLQIDGEAATGSTFLGETLATPAKMPFTERTGRARERSEGEPDEAPRGPCYLVWHTVSGADDTSRIEFDQETVRALKAVGYLQ